jgi:hypothetical protein
LDAGIESTAAEALSAASSVFARALVGAGANLCSEFSFTVSSAEADDEADSVLAMHSLLACAAGS